MLAKLIKLRLRATLAGFGTAVRGKGKGAKIAFIALMIYAFGAVVFSMGMMFFSLAQPLQALGYDWLYFALAAAMCMMLCLVGSIFTCKSQIYSAKDNELLLAMPIKPRDILAARIVSVTTLNWFYCALVLIPALIARFIALGFDIITLARFIPMFIMLPLMPEAVGCLLGWVLSIAERHVQNKNLFTTIGSLIFMVAYFMLVNKINDFLPYLTENGEAVASTMALILPIYSFGMGVTGDAANFCLFAALSLAAIGVTVLLLARSFAKIALTPSAVRRRESKAFSFTQQSVDSALIYKELRRFVSCPGYMLNAGLGLIMLLFVSVALAANRGQLTFATLLMGGAGALPIGAVLAALLTMVSTMTFISASSISLEGKNIWLLRSLPIEPGKILLAKARLHWLLCLPFCLISSLICGIAYDVTAAEWPVLIILPVLENVLCALMGVTINLIFPKFDWITETQVVKQGMSTMVAMLVGMASVITPVVIYMALLSSHISTEIAVYLWAALLGLGCIALRSYLTHGGAKRFEHLT